jgi:molybdopterin-dependent oxidoreductase alpha subunit
MTIKLDLKLEKTWNPQHWASWKPFGIGEQRPNNYKEVFRAVWESRDNLGYAWRILNDGVCDGCALGTSGLSDWTLPGPHLCNIRLRLLRLNTMPALEAGVLGDIVGLRARSSAELRDLGRLPFPMRRKRGEKGFSRISWDEALRGIADKIRVTKPERAGYFLTSRGIPNETYYAIGKAVRAMGSSNIDNAARVCHAPSTVALKETIGVAATTCSYTDFLETDLIVFIGSNVANNQPVATKYLHYAKKTGAKVVCVNTYIEPGMDRYWVPSAPESALFGTKITDRWFLVNTGGDAAFLTGALKHITHNHLEDREWIDAHTNGFDVTRDHVANLDWSTLERESGTTQLEMQSFGQMLGEAKRAILVWSMGITQHVCGEDNVRAIVNLVLARGFVGREGCGLMPIRGHSGVQGGAEMGAYATAFPGGKPVTPENAKSLEAQYDFKVPSTKGLTAPEMLESAASGELDVLVSVGGNFLEVMPDPDAVRESLERVSLRVHMDLFLSSQMLVDGEDVIVLPAMTRYEIPGGVTETSTERRVIFSPEIPGPRIEEARSEIEVFNDIALLVNPELDGKLETNTPAIRNEISRIVPFYSGIEKLERKGDQFQYGGRYLCENGEFALPGGRANFSNLEIRGETFPEGMFRVSTRRGKQFNSMIHEQKDALNGAVREAVLISSLDAKELELETGDSVRLSSQHGSMDGRVLVAPVKPGNLQVHWPEGNVLLEAGRGSSESHIPDYNAFVRLEKILAG